MTPGVKVQPNSDRLAEQVRTRETGIPPQIMPMLWNARHLFETETIDRACILAVWEPKEETRHGETNPASLLRSANGLPRSMIGGSFISGRNRFRDKWRASETRDRSQFTEKLDVTGAAVKAVI